MNRRDTVLALLALGVTPLAAEAQQPQRLPRVGLLTYRNLSPAPFPEGAVVAGLKELGWVDGQNITLQIRYAEGRPPNGYPTSRAPWLRRMSTSL